MNTPHKLLGLCAALLLAAACNETVEVGGDNNGAVNNGAVNNGVNNGDNNGAVNNGVDPNNGVNNGVDPNNGVNNGAVNNGVNNGDNNGDNNGGVGCRADGECEAGSICVDAACVPGCRDNSGCGDGTVCVEGRCIECRDDGDCTLGTICEANACVDGCRDDAGCASGQICAEGLCAAGCREDAACGQGAICVADACVTGCRDDAACGDGEVCAAEVCVAGCREDAACALGQICVEGACAAGCVEDARCGEGLLCVEGACVARGVACREDADCNPGDVCNEALRCEAGEEPCSPDALEPNDDAAVGLAAGLTTGLSVCPGDVDRFAVALAQDDTVQVRLVYSAQGGLLHAELLRDGQSVSQSEQEEGGAALSWTADQGGDYVLRVWGDGAETRNSYAVELTVIPAQTCVDTTLYADADDDGYGDAQSAQVACLEPGESREGAAARAGDCAPNDAWRNPEGHEVCGDNLDDDCDGNDLNCPASQPSVQVPAWDCEGEAPANVYAYAKFPNGNAYFQDGACFIFFEGLPGEFYVQHNLARTSTAPGCASINGCTCPSLNGWPSYDRRLYAFTLQGTPDDCAEVSIRDHGGEDQPVSNACRKYLYQLHYYDIAYSFVAAGVEALEARLSAFPTVEVACAEDAPHRNLPYATLMTAPVTRNGAWAPLE